MELGPSAQPGVPVICNGRDAEGQMAPPYSEDPPLYPVQQGHNQVNIELFSQASMLYTSISNLTCPLSSVRQLPLPPM